MQYPQILLKLSGWNYFTLDKIIDLILQNNNNNFVTFLMHIFIYLIHFNIYI